MSGSVEFYLKGVAFSIMVIGVILAAFIAVQAVQAQARANIDQYLTSAPNSWEPMGYNVNGTAAKQVVDRLGWNKIKIIGNVGIGNGGMQALNDSTAPAGNYTDHYFMGGDISTIPLDSSRYGSASTAGAPDEESNVSSLASASTSTYRINNMGQYNNGSISFNKASDHTYPIHAGDPVNDMQYQNPGSLTICDSAMLRGLSLPGGRSVNVCLRCLGYGY